jgi:hypothetical protein
MDDNLYVLLLLLEMVIAMKMSSLARSLSGGDSEYYQIGMVAFARLPVCAMKRKELLT